MRARVRTGHGAAGATAFVLAVTFLISSVTVELVGSDVGIANVKRGIVLVIPLLALSAIVAGGSGRWLSGKSKARIISGKAKRMRLIGANAVLILIPCAVMLDRMATAGEFGARFVVLQGVELVFGATNVALLGLNLRDGLRMRARRTRRVRPRSVVRVRP